MDLILDITIILLVTIMIIYAIILNKKLLTFRNAQEEMASLVGQLNVAIVKAQNSIETLKKAAQTEEGRLESLVKKSRLLADELEIITESGSNLADRIEQGLVPQKTQVDFGDPDDRPALESPAIEEDNEMLETLKNVR